MIMKIVVTILFLVLLWYNYYNVGVHVYDHDYDKDYNDYVLRIMMDLYL